MTLSIVLFLRALLFFALATSLAAGMEAPIPAPMIVIIRLLKENKNYLTQYAGPSPWFRIPTQEPPGQVSRFLFDPHPHSSHGIHVGYAKMRPTSVRS